MKLAVESGGTKIIARLAGAEIDVTARWPTTSPDQAVEDILGFVAREAAKGENVTGIGIAAFGPLLLDGPGAGTLLETPKPQWTGANVAAALSEALDCPFFIETDVNAAALAEHARAPECRTLAYLTVGTGIGGGLSFGQSTLHGALHPEVGHLRLVRADGDAVPSVCPYHADCAEGLVAGPAMAFRLGGETFGDRPAVHALAAGYLAQLIASLVLAWSPDRVVLGGGVGTASGMLEAVRAALPTAIGGYGVGPAARQPGFVVAPKLADAGLEGAMMLAELAAR